ncbi:uncharacterized protein FSUBG_7594 [Fusarium subglutinans]|uniref:Uncharacterized protein n=1 Tax=Gibberella subglutinans TaxID=42677 RepID=A0A8H5UYC5_GIBSU|nr:uncharacterized protein FSUBG_7594 [Fusarium subglutinans]KAF5602718.1 hypothetical protein FSUBG_7594 [Fusarium subglutinans]
MPDKLLDRRKDVPTSTTRREPEKELVERIHRANFEINKLEVDKEYVKKRIDKLRQGKDQLKEIIRRTWDREEESKRKGQEAQRQKSAILARSYILELEKHEKEIKAVEYMLEDLDRRQNKWDLELKNLRDLETKGRNSVAKVQK